MIKTILKCFFISSLFSNNAYAENKIENYVILFYNYSEIKNYPQGLLSNIKANIKCGSNTTELKKENFLIQEDEIDENYAEIPVQLEENCELKIFEFSNSTKKLNVIYKAKNKKPFTILLNKNIPLPLEENENRVIFESTPVTAGYSRKLTLSASISGDNYPYVTPIVRMIYD